MVAVGIQRMFSNTIMPVSFQFNPPDGSASITLEIGFIETRR
jgi:hypothetical protein